MMFVQNNLYLNLLNYDAIYSVLEKDQDHHNYRSTKGDFKGCVLQFFQQKGTLVELKEFLTFKKIPISIIKKADHAHKKYGPDAVKTEEKLTKLNKAIKPFSKLTKDAALKRCAELAKIVQNNQSIVFEKKFKLGSEFFTYQDGYRPAKMKYKSWAKKQFEDCKTPFMFKEKATEIKKDITKACTLRSSKTLIKIDTFAGKFGGKKQVI